MQTGATGAGMPEDEIDRQLRALTEETAGEVKFKEASAAERQKLGQQKRAYYAQEEKDRARELKRLRRPMRKARRKRRLLRAARVTMWVASALALVGACVFAFHRFHATAASGQGSPNDTQVVTNGAVPTLSSLSPLDSSPAPAAASGPPGDPFSGVPADKWADGAAGIVLPAAKPIGTFSSSQVESAYQTTKKLLIAAGLDRPTLVGGAPTAFTNLLTAAERSDFISSLNKIGIDKHGDALSSRNEIVQFAPGTTKLVGTVIKVYGTMHAKHITRPGVPDALEVDIDYAMAYAVEPPKAPDDWMRIVAQFTGSVQFGNWQGDSGGFTPLWLASPSVAGARCETQDGFDHPDYPNGPADTVQPSGPATNPYALSTQPATGGCETTTGT